MYNADMEYRFDWRADREPSYEDMVFCLERGWKDEEEAVEAREGVCNMTDILTATSAASTEDQATASDVQDALYTEYQVAVSRRLLFREQSAQSR